MNLQDKIDRAYPRFYDYEVTITKEQWMELIKDPEIFYAKNIEHLKCMYSFENHAATCKEVSQILGGSASTYVGLATNIAKRVAKKLNLESLPAREGDSDIYWYILFYGQEANDSERGSFEWKLRPELAAALKEMYPELEYPQPIVEQKIDDVPTAIWLATSLLTYKSYKNAVKPEDTKIFYETKEIQKEAEKICSKKIHNPRISQWCNGDHNDHTYRYLRAEKTLRRLTAPGEFGGDKERPATLNMEMEFELGSEVVTVKTLIAFVENEYSNLINGEEIDLEAIVRFLSSHAGEEYKSPEKAGDQAGYMKQLKAEGTAARQNFISIGERVGSVFPNYVMGKCSSWLNQAQKVQDYFWIEFKKKGFEEGKSSISLVAWKNGEDIIFNTSVEARDNACTQEDFDKHNRLIYKEKDDADLFYRVFRKDGNQVVGQQREEIVEQLENNELVKIRLESVIGGPYHNALTGPIVSHLRSSIKALEPYYNLTIGEEEGMTGTEMEGIVRQENPLLEQIYSLNSILYGPPGTGKTYKTVLHAVAICEQTALDVVENKPYKEVRERFEKLKDKGRIAFTTFHQSYGYEEFIEGIKPVIRREVDSNTDIQYEYASGVFKKFCETAKNVHVNGKPYVFIIDEINRGNISKIFGELITLIEPTKRLGSAEAATAILPYTGDPFGVPNNVFILGTMNTADRSIALMDTALRRRFQFVEMMPDAAVLAKLGIGEIEGVDIVRMFNTINERIEYLYDREHTIGHAYFTSLAKDPSLKNLAEIFLNGIIPLLQEYFYEDYSKIQLVLGDNDKTDPGYKLILDEEIKARKVFKGNPDIDLPEKKYKIQREAFVKAESYIQIYQ